MKRSVYLAVLILFVLAAVPAAAAAEMTSVSQQTPESKGAVRATLIDQATNEAIPGAVVEIAPVSDTTQKRYTTSAYGGAVNIPAVAYGDYRMRITFLGYEEIVREVNVGRETVNLGKIYMEQEAKRIGTVVAEGQAMRTSQKGDTLSYNASAFKVTQDADTESLLSKMPGITVIDGSVEAQGETVQKVFVDGKEFFGQDVSTTIRTIPAEVVSRIEVYNKMSDQAEFTGIDDGEGFKAINIVTTVNKGQFGKMSAGYGFNDKYSLGANINMFNGDHRFALIGMANNTNQQNFAMEDILGAVNSGSGGMSSRGGGRMRGAGNFMVRQLDGISTTQSFGLNYSGKWGKQKKVDVTGSYFFNNSKNENERTTDRQYIDGRPWTYDAGSESETRNNEHRLRARIDYKINDNHSLMIRPSVSLQNYKYNSEGYAQTYDISNAMLHALVRGDSTGMNTRNTGYNISNALIYRVKLGKPGRTLTVDLWGRMSDNDRKENSYTFSEIAGGTDSRIDQRVRSDRREYQTNGSLVYTEPLTQYSQITAQYRASYRYSDADRKSYLWNGLDYIFSDDYSNIYNSGYLTHRAGPGYTYSKDRNNFNASVFYEHATLKNDREFPTSSKMEKSFDNVVYFMRLEKTFNPSTTMRLFARSYTANPSINQLQDVVDLSNTQFISGGNPGLQPAYSHNVFGNFVKSNVAKGTTFMTHARVQVQSDYIADYVITDPGSTSLPAGVKLENGAQYSSFRNLSGYWSVDGRVNYGFPLKPLRSNLNIGVEASYRETPSMINDHKNTLSGQYYFGSLVLGSNISENVDFTITYNAGYNVATSSVNNNYNNEYFIQYAELKFKVVAWAGFTFSGNLAYTQNKGITDDYNDELVMCNLYLGKKVFRSKRGEIIFGVNDLFDQTTSFRRNVTTQYVENIRNNALGRYFGLQFVFNLRSFGAVPGQGGGDTLHQPMHRPGAMGPPPGHGGFR